METVSVLLAPPLTPTPFGMVMANPQVPITAQVPYEDPNLARDPATQAVRRVSKSILDTHSLSAEAEQAIVKSASDASQPEVMLQLSEILMKLSKLLQQLHSAVNGYNVLCFNSSYWLGDILSLTTQCCITLAVIRDTLVLGRLHARHWTMGDHLGNGAIRLFEVVNGIIKDLLDMLASPKAQASRECLREIYAQVMHSVSSQHHFLKRLNEKIVQEENAVAESIPEEDVIAGTTPGDDKVAEILQREEQVRRLYIQISLEEAPLQIVPLFQAALDVITARAWLLKGYRYRTKPDGEWTVETPELFSCKTLYFALEVSHPGRGVIGHLINDEDVDGYLSKGSHDCKNSWFCGMWRSLQVSFPDPCTIRDHPPPFPGAEVGWVTEELTFETPNDAQMVSMCLSILTGALQTKCAADILSTHRQHLHLQPFAPEQMPYMAWLASTREPAYEPLEVDEVVEWLEDEDEGME